MMCLWEKGGAICRCNSQNRKLICGGKCWYCGTPQINECMGNPEFYNTPTWWWCLNQSSWLPRPRSMQCLSNPIYVHCWRKQEGRNRVGCICLYRDRKQPLWRACFNTIVDTEYNNVVNAYTKNTQKLKINIILEFKKTVDYVFESLGYRFAQVITLLNLTLNLTLYLHQETDTTHTHTNCT